MKTHRFLWALGAMFPACSASSNDDAGAPRDVVAATTDVVTSDATSPPIDRAETVGDVSDAVAPDGTMTDAVARDVATLDVVAPDVVVGDGSVSRVEPTDPTVFYAGGAHAVRLNTALALSDGTFLLGGGADDLDWLPASVPRATLGVTGILGSPGGARVAFVLQVSGDLRTPLQVATLPPGAAQEVRHLRVTSAPDAPTGVLYLSGTTREDRAAGSGTFVARLDANFVARAPTRAVWVRNWYATGTHRTSQPWDVDGEGRVVYAVGEPFGPNWAAVYRLRADGTDDVVEDWRYHWGTRADGTRVEGGWTPASSRADVTVTQSGMVFKTTGRCDLRSWTMADYQRRDPDGNGGTRQGAWPMDLFFSGPCDPARPTTMGPGYTGYSMGANPTQQVGAIAIDRRTNDLYVGFSTQSRLPGGNPDFEPAVMAMTASGRLRWWSRLYTESPSNSLPDQFVDRLEVDPATGELVVLARCHGNDTHNYWAGNAVAARPGATSFHHQFTGSNGNIHVSWLGRLAAADGTLRAASYLAEYVDTITGTGAPYAEPLLDGWPSHNAAWPDLNTTRAEALAVAPDRRVVVVATGRRTITTRNAYMRMPQRAMGASGWNDFVRAYEPDLSTLAYSSILRSPWDPARDGGDGNVKLMAVVPLRHGALAVGYHVADASGAAAGAPMPTTRVPAWGIATPSRESAVLAWLPW